MGKSGAGKKRKEVGRGVGAKVGYLGIISSIFCGRLASGGHAYIQPRAPKDGDRNTR